jgi:hypothetical protein
MIVVLPYRAIAERRLTDRLMHANAVSPGSGQPLDALRWSERRVLPRLLAADVVREEAPGRYYLYVPAYVARKNHRRQRLAIGLIFVIVALAVTAILASALAG